MKPQDWFGLVVRVLGLLAVIASPFYILGAFTQNAQVSRMPEASPLGYLIFGIAIASIGFYLLQGAPHLTRLAYPDKSQDSGAEPAERTVPPEKG